MHPRILATALACFVFIPGLAQTARYAPYVHATGVSGAVSVVGSDVFEPIFNQWGTGLQRYGITAKFAPEGSTAGVLALMENQAQVAAMSRDMSKAELSEFGPARPTRLVVGVDALVIFVNPGNPIKSITLEQLDAIYSTSRKQGGKALITTWGALGMKDPQWENRRISLYGRDEFSGPRASFREKILLKGEFRPGISIKEEATALVDAVSLDSGGLGYSSISDLSSLVKAVPIIGPSGNPVLPSTDSITKGEYPLSNFLYMYVKQPVTPPVAAFITYVFSEEGQRAMGANLIPIPADVAKEMIRKIH
jgi:phosphate transport system substrate-binding protein